MGLGETAAADDWPESGESAATEVMQIVVSPSDRGGDTEARRLKPSG